MTPLAIAMDLNAQKERYSLAFISLIAAAAGCKFVHAEQPDDDSVDATLQKRGRFGRSSSPRIDLQVKATANIDPGADRWHFVLRMKNFDDLRQPDLQVARILVVVAVPDDVANWTEASPRQLGARYAARWISLAGAPASENATSVTVELLDSQGFHVDGVRDLFDRLGRGELR